MRFPSLSIGALAVQRSPFVGSALVTICFLLLQACQLSGNAPNETMQSFASREAMTDYLRRALAAGSTEADLYYARDSTAVAAPASGVGSSAGGVFSSTNLQEAGVDEADRLKSDGRYLYLVGRSGSDGGDSLLVRELTGEAPATAALGAGSREVARLALPPGVHYARAYLARLRSAGGGDLLVALGEPEYFDAGPPVVGRPAIALVRDWFAPTHWGGGKSEFLWIDVSAPAAPVLGRRLAVDGHLVASRRVGETLYVVSRFYPQVSNPETATLDQMLPKWSLDGVVQGNLVDADRCYLPAGTSARATADLIVVSAIDLAAPASGPKAQCLVGSSEAVYVSQASLYVATTQHNYSVQPFDGRLWASYPSEVSTDLHKFALSGEGPVYKGSAKVAGHLGWEQGKKSFRMGEHQGILRIATSLGSDWDSSATTQLSVLREGVGKLELVATLPNATRPAPIGKPGERLYAARFVGARAYLVTFRITDPLYVLDLADPADPKIAGELSIPGYSDYLHPVGERWLLGVGKDAVASPSLGDGRGAFYQGVKVALFDVSNAALPREVNSLVIGKRGSQSAALSDHHAFAFLPTGDASGGLGRLALPIVRHTTPGYGDPESPNTWYDWTDTGLHLFEVAESGVAAHGEMIVEARSTSLAYPRLHGEDDRGFLVGDEVHYLHGMEVTARRW